MAKYKRYDYSQKLFIPVSLEDQLMPGTLGSGKTFKTLITSKIPDDHYTGYSIVELSIINNQEEKLN